VDMTLRCLLLCTCLLVINPGAISLLHAQDSAEPGTSDRETAEGAEGAENLVEKTLGNDINTASYYELVAWCRELGLDDTGTRQALQQRLYGYFKISPPPVETAPAEKSRLLEIKSAKETQYFTVEQVDEDYVLLLGDVLVEIKEEEATHRIRAHKILLNETENILSAEGGIEYTLIKGAEEEFFRGERLTFDVDSWEGVFFSGGMEADRAVGGETIRFRFTGESISRLEENTVVIDQGRITSCDAEGDPHYHIRARKIWVLAPNEWAILHAVLYVGRIPLLYLPFFFHPGDEFFFHPAIGYRDREGQFVQTTTYLIGQKKRSSSALSFLAATEESTTQYELEREGLFLRPIPDKPTVVDEDRFLKVMLDIYSRLGIFAGVEGSFPKVDFKGGIARSRTIYGPFDGYYTPWFDGSNTVSSSWNDSYLFEVKLPLRFGLESSWNLSNGPYSLTGRFEYFSDPYFTSDFYDRAEDTGLTRLVGIEPIEEIPTEGERQNLTWDITGKVDFSERFKTDLVKTLSFTSINGNLFWKSRENEQLKEETIEAPIPTPPDVFNDDPARKFYYPESLKLPRVSFRMLGNLLNLTLPSVKRAEKPAGDETPPPTDLRSPNLGGVRPTGTPPEAVRPPEGRTPEGRTPGTPPEAVRPAEKQLAEPIERQLPSLRPPESKKSVPVSLQKTPLQFGLSYQVRPNMSMEQTFNADNWNEPQDINYDLKYTSVDTQGSSSLDYSLRILENVLSWSGNFVLTGNYRYLRRQSVSQDEWNTELLNAQSDSQFNLKLTNGLDYLPFADDPIFGKTSLAYDLSWVFYNYSLNQALSTLDDPVYQGSGPEFSSETVSQHSMQAAFRWRMFEADNSLSVSAQLYPRQGSLTGNLQFTVWLLTTTVNSVLQDPNSDWSDGSPWVFQPLIVKETLNLGENVRISEEFQFDLKKTPEDGLFARSLTSLNLWNFYGSLTYEWMEEQVYSGGTFVPAGTPEEFLPSYVTLGYKLEGKDRLFWKNRMRMNTTIDTSWYMNIEQFTDNNFTFSLTFTFWLHKFLELSLTTTSYNNRTFQYFSALAEEVGRPAANPITDLIN
jgi:hypothetical protein